MYGLETIHLTKSLTSKLNAFHHRGLRKILHVDTTFVNHANTTARLFEAATQAARKPVVPFDQMLSARRVKLAGHNLRSPDTDPLRQVSYQPGSAQPYEIGRRIVMPAMLGNSDFKEFFL